MNIRIIGFLAFILFIFFLVIAGDLVMNASRKTSYEELREPPAIAKEFIAKQSNKQKVDPNMGFRLGNTSSEIRYQKAMDSILEDEKLAKERRQARAEKRSFLNTEAGEYFDSGLKLLKTGQKEEARAYLMKALDLHNQYDYATYMVLIKTILRTYIKEDDLKEIDGAVLKYLNLIKTQYSETEFQKVVSDMLTKIEAKINYAD